MQQLPCVGGEMGTLLVPTLVLCVLPECKRAHRPEDCRVSQCIWIFLQVFITNGWLSDLVIVVAVTNREARSPAHGISLFLVENGMKGFIKGRKLHKMGMKAQVSHGLNQTLIQKVDTQSCSWRLPEQSAGMFSETARETSFQSRCCLCHTQEWEGTRVSEYLL